MSRTAGRDRGGLEREVLACLAAAGRPLTAAEVLGELGGDLAYTTVMTTLARLHAKHALIREPEGRAYAYAITGDQRTAQASITAFQMRRLLDRDSDRAGVLARFIADLSPEDERLLTELLAEDGSGPGPGVAT